MATVELTTKANSADVKVTQGTTLKVGDTLPSFQCSLSTDGSVYDLTDKTPKLHMKQQNADSKTIDGETMTVVDAKNGELEYQWDSTETNTAGDFDLEIVVEDSNGDERTFPISGFVGVTINEDLQ